MPQLDSLTFFSQILSISIFFLTIFIFTLTTLLPRLHRALKAQFFLTNKASSIDVTFLTFLYNVGLCQVFLMENTFSSLTENFNNVFVSHISDLELVEFADLVVRDSFEFEDSEFLELFSEYLQTSLQFEPVPNFNEIDEAAE